FQEEQAGIKKWAMELQAAVREELGKRGIAGEEETASARAKAGQLERLGFGREVAVQAAAVGVQQGLSDDQLIQLAAGLKAGQVNIEGSKAQVQRKLSTFYKGTLGRSEAASTNAAIIQQTIATREDSLEESLRQERKAIQESQKSVWEMGPGEFVSYIAIGRRNMEELAPRQTELGALGDARRAAAERAVPQPAALQRAAQSARGGPPSVIINSYGTLNLSKNGLDAKVPRAPGL
ncbi:MAG TPA: hypothetical protein PLC79_10890, partial [Phycisphaerae bacterium]|nr:hypothetical protein [Phycisphaerae bacterium]